MDSICRELRFAMWSKRTGKSSLTFTIKFHPYFNRNSEDTPPNFPFRLWNVVESCGDEVFLTGWGPRLFLCFVKGKLSLRLITIKLNVSLIEVWLVIVSVLLVLANWCHYSLNTQSNGLTQAFKTSNSHWPKLNSNLDRSTMKLKKMGKGILIFSHKMCCHARWYE